MAPAQDDRTRWQAPPAAEFDPRATRAGLYIGTTEEGAI